MSLGKIIRGMAAIIPKRNLIDSVMKAQEALTEHVIPMYERSVASTQGVKFRSGFAQQIQSRFNDYRQFDKRETFIVNTLAALKRINENETLILSYVNKVKTDSLATDALQLREVTVLNYQNALNHAIEYASRMINMFWVTEGNVARGKGQFDGQVKGEVVWLQDNLSTFIQELNAMGIDKHTLEQKINGISGTIFDPDEEETTKSLLSPENMDPLGFGFLPLSINPFFIIGRWVVEWQDDRYKALQLDLKRVDLRIKALEEVTRNGNSDPMTEKTIRALDELRKDIQLKLNKIEER